MSLPNPRHRVINRFESCISYILLKMSASIEIYALRGGRSSEPRLEVSSTKCVVAGGHENKNKGSANLGTGLTCLSNSVQNSRFFFSLFPRHPHESQQLNLQLASLMWVLVSRKGTEYKVKKKKNATGLDSSCCKDPRKV